MGFLDDLGKLRGIGLEPLLELRSVLPTAEPGLGDRGTLGSAAER